MKISRIFSVLLVSVLSCACATTEKPDMTTYELNDFRSELDCDKDFQCKTILAGYGMCGNYPKGAAEYFIYSTKIGAKNVRHLKKMARESLPKRKKSIFNFEQELIECTLTLKLNPPPLKCIDKRCQISYQ